MGSNLQQKFRKDFLPWPASQMRRVLFQVDLCYWQTESTAIPTFLPHICNHFPSLVHWHSLAGTDRHTQTRRLQSHLRKLEEPKTNSCCYWTHSLLCYWNQFPILLVSLIAWIPTSIPFSAPWKTEYGWSLTYPKSLSK